MFESAYDQGKWRRGLFVPGTENLLLSFCLWSNYYVVANMINIIFSNLFSHLYW